MSAPIADQATRVLVVDDSAVIRRFLSEILSAPADIEVSTARNGLVALEQLEASLVDVVVLDIEMPVLDGLATLERIRQRWRDLPVVMFSTLTTRGAVATLDALALGATGYVSKPSHLGDLEKAKAAVGAELLPLVRSCATIFRSRAAFNHKLEPAVVSSPPAVSAPLVAGSPVLARLVPAPPVRARLVPAARVERSRCQEAVVIASSTGGPHALTEVISCLPGDLAVPVLVVQHMPALFTRVLAERLDGRSAVKVHEGSDGMAVEPGSVYVAPGGEHMVVRRSPSGGVVLARDDGPPENSCKPAADVLFRSAARLWGPGLTGFVLTGMGHDGLAGARAIREAGGSVYVQDEASSVVWGMPGSVMKEGLADGEVPLAEIADTISRRRSLPAILTSSRPG